jgi:hypothetical protein
MQIVPQIYSGMWIKLPLDVKNRIAEIFHVQKTGYSHVFDNKIVADGYTEEELSKINVSTMREYLVNRQFEFDRNIDDLFILWNIIVSLITEDLKPAVSIKEEVKREGVDINIHIDESGETKVEKTVRRGRPRKNVEEVSKSNIASEGK